MDLLIVFIIFIACMAMSLAMGLTMLLPLGIGFFLFAGLALRRGFALKEIFGYAKGSFRDSFIVVGILLIIGCLTGIWRQSGTVAYFVTLGVSLIPPQMFLLAAFLLAAFMSYAIGTSFGVTATAGVILISIAHAGGVNSIFAAGAILSGVYVGDRGSPAASSANLVAVLTHTDMRRNVRIMLKSSVIPFILCVITYSVLSFTSPMQSIDSEILDMLASEFNLRWFCLIPAIIMIVLPFCNLSIKASMAVSLAASLLVSVFVQHESIIDCVKAMLLGYSAKSPELTNMISGGGISSMLEVCGILLISGTYGGIFRGTGLLSAVNEKLSALASRIGRYPVMLILGAGVCALFCNQTIGAIMQSQLADGLYGDSEEEKYSKMIDMENSVILEAGLVPWCIACSVPLAMLGADVRSVPFAFYIWLLPIFWFITGKKKFKVK